MPFDLSALEQSVMASRADDIGDLPETILTPANLDNAPAPAAADLVSEAAWLEQWGAMHDMAGGMIQMRTGSPCPLGDQARGEGGMIAGKACYALIVSSPALARLILSTNSTFFGQIAAIGMHGFACVQIVKASRAPAPELDHEPMQEAA